VLLALSMLLWSSGLLASIERPMADALVRMATRSAPLLPGGQPDVVLVALDPQSLRAIPECPWSRTRHAAAVRRLSAAGARAISFDVDFSTPRDPVGDAEFERAIADAGNVVLAAFRQVQRLPGGIELEVANRPMDTLARVAAGVGNVHMAVDPDGAVRHAPRATRIGAEVLPSLAAVTLDVATGLTPVARSAAGRLPIDYRRSAPPVKQLSMIDVLEGRFDPRDVAGRAVMIGATAAEFQDLWPTPVGPAQPGVWIQAITLRTLAAGRSGGTTLQPAPLSARTLWLAALMAAAGTLALRSHRWRVAGLLGATGVALAAPWLALVWLGWLATPLVPVAALATQHVLGLERIRARFRRRLSDREDQVAALARVGEATSAPREGDGLAIALGLLADVVGASGVALLRAGAAGRLDGRRIDWRPDRSHEREIGDAGVAQEVLAAREVRNFSGELPGGGRGLAVYMALHAGASPIGVLIVERDREEALDETQLRTIATVGTQLALSAENLRLIEGLRATFDSAIEAIASAVEARDGYTESHCRRLATFSTLMAHRLGLDAGEIEAIRLGALLHDVGKVGIRDEVLLKPGGLTPEERVEMEGHADVGHRIIVGIHGLVDTTRACVRHHHERWDGTGYPDRLQGEAIPLGARIVSVVDVWDALSTVRPYKAAFSQEKVREILEKGRGTHFDPALVDLFLELLDEEGEDLLAIVDGRRGS
jgi:HD-GYP domain-containing protein (c-di-GMP phosphodiesterase class II)/CHASE2 domain-containing sensor protein